MTDVTNPWKPSSDRAVLIAAAAVVARENIELAANLTATQTRCTELLDEARMKGRVIEHLEAQLKTAEDERDILLDGIRRLAPEAKTGARQAETIARLEKFGYRIVKNCGNCVAMRFERT